MSWDKNMQLKKNQSQKVKTWTSLLICNIIAKVFIDFVWFFYVATTATNQQKNYVYKTVPVIFHTTETAELSPLKSKLNVT